MELNVCLHLSIKNIGLTKNYSYEKNHKNENWNSNAVINTHGFLME